MRDRILELADWVSDPRRLLILGAWGLSLAGWILVGGVHPWSQTLLAAAALLLGLAGLVYSMARKRRTSMGLAFWIPATMAVAATLQALPIPLSVLSRLDHETARFFEVVTRHLPLVPRPAITWDRPATVLSALHLTAFAALVFLGAVIARREGDTKRFAWGLDALLLSVAALALLNWLTGDRRVWWVYEPKASGAIPLPPMVNPNHAAGLYLFGLCLHLGLASELPASRTRRFHFALALLPGFMVALAQSRGGYAGALFGLFILGFLLKQNKKISARAFWQSAAAVALVTAGLLPSVAYIREAFGATGIEGIPDDAKVQMWGRALGFAFHHPLLGTGRGAFMQAFAPANQVISRTVTHAENILVQVTVDYGPVLALLFLAGAVYGVARFFRRRALSPVQAGMAAGLAGLFLQNIGDFNLEFPGTAYPAALILGLLAGNHRIRRRRRPKDKKGRKAPDTSGPMAALSQTWRRNLAAGAVLALGAALSVWAMFQAAPHAWMNDSARVRQALSSGDLDQAQERLETALAYHPFDGHFHLLYGVVLAAQGRGKPLAFLNVAMLLNPKDPRPHLETARVLARAGRLEQAASELRRAFHLGLKPTKREWAEVGWLSWALVARRRNRLEAFSSAQALAGVATDLLGQQVLGAADELVSDLIVVLAATAPVPKEPEPWIQVGRLLLARNMTRTGAAVFRAVARNWPGRAKVLGQLARLALRRQDLESALWWMEQYAKAVPQPEVLAQLVRLTERAKGTQAAYEASKAASAEHPDNVDLAVLLANTALKLNRIQEAQQALDALLKHRDVPLKERPKILNVEIRIAQRLGDSRRVRLLTHRLERIRLAIDVAEEQRDQGQIVPERTQGPRPTHKGRSAPQGGLP